MFSNAQLLIGVAQVKCSAFDAIIFNKCAIKVAMALLIQCKIKILHGK